MSTPATLNINTSIVAHGDPTLTNNPRLKFFDWTRNLNGLQVSSPKAEQYLIPAWSSKTLFDGTRTIYNGGDTDTFVDLYHLTDSTYRIELTGATNGITLATEVDVTFSATEITAVVTDNQTLIVTATAATPFSGLSVDDWIYIYTLADNPSASFSAANAGFWIVLSVDGSGASATLVRKEGESFQGTSEVVTCDSASNFIAFQNVAVEVGDKLWLTTPFARATCGMYEVQSVTSKWVDFVSTSPLADQADLSLNVTPGSQSILVFSECKRFVRVEVDRRATVQINDSVGDRNLDPWVAGERESMGWHELTGYTWKLVVDNKSASPMSVNLFTAE